MQGHGQNQNFDFPHEPAGCLTIDFARIRLWLSRSWLRTVPDYSDNEHDNPATRTTAFISTGFWDNGTVAVFLWALPSLSNAVNQGQRKFRRSEDFVLSAIATWVPMLVVPFDITGSSTSAFAATGSEEVPGSDMGGRIDSGPVRAVALVRSPEGSGGGVSLVAGGADGTVAVTHLRISFKHGQPAVELHTLSFFQVGHGPMRFDIIRIEYGGENFVRRRGSRGVHGCASVTTSCDDGEEGILVNGDADAVILPRERWSKSDNSVVQNRSKWYCTQVRRLLTPYFDRSRWDVPVDPHTCRWQLVFSWVVSRARHFHRRVLSRRSGTAYLLSFYSCSSFIRFW